MNFMSYEHLVEECPTIPVVREMFGDCNTYNSNWRDHPNFSWKPQPPQSWETLLELEIHQCPSHQRIDSVESSLNKRMDEIQSQGGIAKMMKEKEEKREFWPLVLFPLSGHIWSTSSSPFYTYYIPFRSSGSQESNASNGVQIGVETKKLWSLQENCTELSGNFAHLNPRHGLQAMKWPPSFLSHKMMCKNTLQSQGSCKMPTEPHNHASKEESPLTEITHEVSHSISYLLKPSQPIAPAESSS
ncbi:hypothetical protein AAG906_008033 [Vitis piasezkii]